MTTLQAPTTDFRAHFAASDSTTRPDRLAALDRFEATGIPSMKREEWKYTNLRELAETRFSARATRRCRRHRSSATACVKAEVELVFVNGKYSAALSSGGPLPKGVRVESLADVVSELGTDRRDRPQPVLRFEHRPVG